MHGCLAGIWHRTAARTQGAPRGAPRGSARTGAPAPRTPHALREGRAVAVHVAAAFVLQHRAPRRRLGGRGRGRPLLLRVALRAAAAAAGARAAAAAAARATAGAGAARARRGLGRAAAPELDGLEHARVAALA
jgi:hypothetical protein